MAGIGSVGSLGGYGNGLSAIRTSSEESVVRKQAATRLDQALAAAGVSEETRKALEADLAKIFEE